MRIEGYIKRLIDATNDQKADPERLAYLVERTLEKVAESKAGEEAVQIVQRRIARQHFRRAAKAA